MQSASQMYEWSLHVTNQVKQHLVHQSEQNEGTGEQYGHSQNHMMALVTSGAFQGGSCTTHVHQHRWFCDASKPTLQSVHAVFRWKSQAVRYPLRMPRQYAVQAHRMYQGRLNAGSIFGSVHLLCRSAWLNKSKGVLKSPGCFTDLGPGTSAIDGPSSALVA